MPYVSNPNRPTLSFKDMQPEDVIGRTVSVRPWYHVPVSRTGLRAVQSEWTVRVQVVDRHNDNTVVVTWNPIDSYPTAPWMIHTRAAFRMDELHDVACKCPACTCDIVWQDEERAAA